jgi:hypothetical protein
MSIFSSKKPPSFLDAWKQDAEDFGLPENVQKGLIFLIAMKSRIDPNLQSPEKLLGRAHKLCDRVSLNPPLIPENLGGDFYDGEIQHLLTELAERSPGNFESREVSLPNTDKMRVWKRGEQDRLPACLNSETSLLSDWDEVITSLCDLIGNKINDELDEAFIDGFHMVESYYPMDNAGTVQIINTATMPLPPHFKWLEWCLEFDAEMLSKGNPVNKVLQSFLGPMHPSIARPTVIFSDNLHYQGPGEKRQEIWDATVSEFTYTAGSIPVHINEPNSEESIETAKSQLLENGFTPPSSCSSLEGIGQTLRDQIRGKWGYDILNEEESLCLGAQYTRRACVSLLCIANGILHPNWNDVPNS